MESVKVSWSKLNAFFGEKDMKILIDKKYISGYKKKCEELDEKININNQAIEELKLKNDELQDNIPILKKEYESELKNLSIIKRAYFNSSQLITAKNEQNSAQLAKYYESCRLHSKELSEFEMQMQRCIPDYEPYNKQLTIVRRYQIKEKILRQDIDDIKKKILLKEEIRRTIFNMAVVEFVKKVNNYKEHVKIVKEIEQKIKIGNTLLQMYNNKSSAIENRKSRNVNILKQIPLGPLPQLNKVYSNPRLSPPSSVISVKSSTQKYSLDKIEINKIKQREMNRKDLLKRLASNEKFLSAAQIAKPIPKMKQPIPMKAPNCRSSEVNKFTPEMRKRQLDGNDVPQTPKKKFLETVIVQENIIIKPASKNEDETSEAVSSQISAFENKGNDVGGIEAPAFDFKQNEVFSPFFKENTSNTYIAPEATTVTDVQENDVFKVPKPYFMIPENQDLSFNDGRNDSNKSFQYSQDYDELPVLSPPVLESEDPKENSFRETNREDFFFF